MTQGGAQRECRCAVVAPHALRANAHERMPLLLSGLQAEAAYTKAVLGDTEGLQVLG